MNEKETVLVLRTCDVNLRSYGEFQWPSEIGATVTAPDWRNNAECGNGLHGWLYGHGDHECSGSVNYTDANWLVLEVEFSKIVMLGGKCKFPSCVLRFVGPKKEATDYLIANEPRAREVAVIGASVTVGEKQGALVGALGTATAGDSGTATAGYSGTATAGYRGNIQIKWWDDKRDNYRIVTGYIGEDGLEANVAYKLDDEHKFIKA